MKAYTDLSQSKILAKILPLDSADMSYTLDFLSERYEISTTSYKSWIVPKYAESYKGLNQVIPCWSLAALLDLLESEIDGEEGETYQLNLEKDGTWWNVWYREQYDEANPIEVVSTEELIDACIDMILKLKEMNLL